MTRNWTKIAIYPLMLLVAAVTMTACSSDDDSDATPVTTVAPAPTEVQGSEGTAGDDTASTTTPGTDGNGDGDGDCFVHLYDSDDFDASDDNYKLTEEGRYATMDDLPGADKDWADDADSIEVGDGATVTIWEQENFEGASQELDAGSQHPDIEEPSSIELSCN